MDAPDPITRDGDERDEFLDTGGTGVLSLAPTDGGAPHAVPASYGYDAAAGTVYFRLAAAPDSVKGDPADRPATFVTYGREGRWRSALAPGRPESIAGESIGTEALAGLESLHIPLIDVFGRPPREAPFEFYRLVPDDLTGRKESTSGA